MVRAIEERDAVAAITAVSRGVPTVGLEGEDLERFLRREGVRKVSSRDLGAAVALGLDGATTVAGSLALARLARLQVFATGGIGGVHRNRSAAHGGNSVRDESADLIELSRSPLIVVCTGAKSILDLSSTWERLETLGIPVIGYRTDELPGFFTAETGIALTCRVDSAAEIVAIASAHWKLGNHQSVLVVQPPPDTFSLSARQVEQAVDRALAESEEKGVKGARVTPYLLQAVDRLTDGRSLQANLELLEENAALAADIACALTTASAPRE
jgi:pseudouridine-5'-phosphate glycosidase